MRSLMVLMLVIDYIVKIARLVFLVFWLKQNPRSFDIYSLIELLRISHLCLCHHQVLKACTVLKT